MKKKAVIGLVAALCLGSSMTVFAAPEVMPDGTVFDAEYYAENNPDVVAAMGTDKDAMYLHYTLFGANEGRLPFAPGAQVQSNEQTDEGLPVEGVLGVFGARYQLPSLNEFEDFDDVSTGAIETRTMWVQSTVEPDWIEYHMEQLAPYTTEGYEWRPIQVVVGGEYVENKGHWWPYYNYRFLAQHSDNWERLEDGGVCMYSFTVTQDGKDYTECRIASFDDQAGEVSFMRSSYFLVPKNYTGNLVYIVRAIKSENGESVVDKTNAVTYVF